LSFDVLVVVEMADDSAEVCNVGDSVKFSLEDGDTSDVDSVPHMTPSEAKLFVGAEGGDDVSLNSHESSSESVADIEEPCPRLFSVVENLPLWIAMNVLACLIGCKNVDTHELILLADIECR